MTDVSIKLPRECEYTEPQGTPTQPHTSHLNTHYYVTGGSYDSSWALPPDAWLNLFRLSHQIISEHHLETILQQSILYAQHIFPHMLGGIVWGYERQVGKLRLLSMAHVPVQEPTRQKLATCQLSPGETVIGRSFQQNEWQHLPAHTMNYHKLAVNVSERNKPLFLELYEQLRQTTEIFCLPIRVNDEVLGVLQLVTHTARQSDATSTETDNPRTTSDDALLLPMGLLQTVACSVGVAMKQSQRYEEIQRYQRRLKIFDAVVTAISSSTDVQNLMQNVLDVVLDLLPVSSGAILLFDPVQKQMTLGAYRALPDEYITVLHHMPVDGAGCEEVIRYGQPIIRPLMEERGEAALLAADVQSCAYLPLLVGGTVVGVLGLYGDALLHKQIDIASLTPLSNQVGFAIANVRLYEDSKLERRKLNTVINSIAEGVVLCDGKGRLILANEAAMSLFSLEAIPFQQPLSDMVDFYGIRDLEGRPLPIEQLPMARALSGEVFHDYRVLLHGASGSNSVMSFSGAPTHSDNGKDIEGAVVIFRDITARQKIERAKDEFLVVAAHEIRNPLSAVRGYSEILLKRELQRSDANSRDVRGLTILSQQVTHMLQMVDNLLDVSRIDAGQLGLQLQTINLVSVTSEVIDQNKPLAANHDLILETDQPDMFISCDMIRIRQVLTNLVSNAIKYSPAETHITVRLSIVERDAIAPHHSPTNDMPDELMPETTLEVLVSVADMGTWIPPDQQEQLFQRYFRAGNRSIDGLGLGLYLSRQFVLMHGGCIWMESVEGKGNTFYFTLPMNN